MRLALVPLNPTIGDLATNAERARDAAERAVDAGAHLVLFPELALCGYPPRDLLLHEGFVEECETRAHALAASLSPAAQRATVLIGSPWRADNGTPYRGAHIANSMLVLSAGRVAERYDKRLLPTYDVFDEDRYFKRGARPVVITVNNLRVGLSICEDLWRGEDADSLARYDEHPDPVDELVRAGAQLVLNPSASPFVLGKELAHRRILTRHVQRHGVAIAALNQLGGNDDLIFNGHASVFVPDGANTTTGGARLVAAAEPFSGQTLLFDLPDDPAAWPDLPLAHDPYENVEPERRLWQALTIGVRDYCAKTCFTSAVLGLSGGIDSALVASIAAGSLGPQRILALSMPSRYSSRGSVDDAAALARALNVSLVSVPIDATHRAAEATLHPTYGALGLPQGPDITDENLQSRLRGLTLMAFSNKTGALLLTTGNKSELAIGYCTLYGDMSGGLAVLSDVTKAWVYRLARWINANHRAIGFDAPPIPQNTIDKPPSAELRPDQKDTDSIPPYDVVDEIVERHVERRQPCARIVRETGFDRAVVERIITMIDASEHKRKQAPVGLKVTSVAFGSGRRVPIAQRWRPPCDGE